MFASGDDEKRRLADLKAKGHERKRQLEEKKKE
jgi:hypothetical protein